MTTCFACDEPCDPSDSHAMLMVARGIELRYLCPRCTHVVQGYMKRFKNALSGKRADEELQFLHWPSLLVLARST